MSAKKQIRVAIARDGTISAETIGIHGAACLEHVAVLEDLLDALSVSSSFTADYNKSSTQSEEGQTLESRQG